MSDDSRLRIALLGAGIFARDAYVPLFRHFEERLTVVAVWSRSEAAAVGILPSICEFSPAAKACHGDAGLRQLLADGAVDAVVVVLPVQVALQVTQQALAAGKHVLQEKPIAPTFAQAVDAIQAYRASQGADTPVWAVAENFRSEKVFQTACGLLPKLGKLIKIDLIADMPMNSKNKYYGSTWRRDSGGCPGGFLMDSSVHYVAALRMLAGAAGWGNEVAASGHALGMDGGLPFPDSLVGRLVYKQGGAASVSLTFAGSQMRFSLSVVGTTGSLEVQRGGWGAGRGSYTLTHQTGSDPAPVQQQFPFSGLEDELEAFMTIVAGADHARRKQKSPSEGGNREGGMEAAAVRRKALQAFRLQRCKAAPASPEPTGTAGSAAWQDLGCELVSCVCPEEAACDLAIVEALLASSAAEGEVVACKYE